MQVNVCPISVVNFEIVSHYTFIYDKYILESFLRGEKMTFDFTQEMNSKCINIAKKWKRKYFDKPFLM